MVLAKDILQHALTTAPAGRKARAAPATKRALSAAAGSLAMATAWHGSSLSKSERGAAISAAAEARPAPELRWFWWATDTLNYLSNFGQESSAEPALLVLEKGVLASKAGAMPLELPSINAKLRCVTRTA